MTERRLPTREEIEAYISEEGCICLKQVDTYQNQDSVVIMNPHDVPIIIKWLQELLEEVEKP